MSEFDIVLSTILSINGSCCWVALFSSVWTGVGVSRDRLVYVVCIFSVRRGQSCLFMGFLGLVGVLIFGAVYCLVFCLSLHLGQIF